MAQLEAPFPKAGPPMPARLRNPPRMTGDVRIIYRQLQAQGRAVWLGETFPDGPAPPPLDDVARAVAHVEALFPETAASTATWLPQPAASRRAVLRTLPPMAGAGIPTVSWTCQTNR